MAEEHKHAETEVKDQTPHVNTQEEHQKSTEVIHETAVAHEMPAQEQDHDSQAHGDQNEDEANH